MHEELNKFSISNNSILVTVKKRYEKVFSDSNRDLGEMKEIIEITEIHFLKYISWNFMLHTNYILYCSIEITFQPRLESNYVVSRQKHWQNIEL